MPGHAGLPRFRYHPNLYGRDILERFEGTCECCGEVQRLRRGWGMEGIVTPVGTVGLRIDGRPRADDGSTRLFWAFTQPQERRAAHDSAPPFS